MEVDVQEDLNAVNDNLQKLVEELNRISAARENLIQQIQNLNGVAMYLRGKLPPEEQAAVDGVVEQTEKEKTDDALERVNEYPS
tara:strand:+ start:65 stop:316 length:252 start_codon:yes stop_codon:yes gene_type:complete